MLYPHILYFGYRPLLKATGKKVRMKQRQNPVGRVTLETLTVNQICAYHISLSFYIKMKEDIRLYFLKPII